MAFSTPKTLAQLRTMCRNMLMDPNARVWDDATLNSYINDWQTDIQNELELVWGMGIAVTTDTSTSFPYTYLATDIQRMDALYWNQQLLTPRNTEEMFQLKPDWLTTSERSPGVVVPVDNFNFTLWPPPSASGNFLYGEYVRTLTLTNDSDTCELPTWTIFSCPYYVAANAYAKDGPVNDINKFRIYRSLYQQRLVKLKSLKSHYTPQHYWSLAPAGRLQADVLLARRRGPDTPMPPIGFHYHAEETPTGTINGTNTSFTLANTPTTGSVELELTGIPVYYTTTISASPMTITAAVHGQGTACELRAFTGSASALSAAGIQWAKHHTTGDITLTYVIAPFAIEIAGQQTEAVSSIVPASAVTVTGTAITFTSPPRTGQVLKARYRYTS